MIQQGTKLGPYEIQSPLGAGGMGEVYRARDTRLERTVAIKVLPSHLSDNPDLKQRFDREARAISSLQHRHICTLFDVGEYGGTQFLVMELLEGETLAARLQRGPMPLAEIVKVGTQVAEALGKAHRAGIVHRDLKPGNIMLTPDGVKLMDFGLAKPLAQMSAMAGSNAAPLLSAAATMSSPSPQMSLLTTAGAIVGTIQYMAPEQIEGRDADARSDIFAFGAVLYEMATGQRAFQGKSQITVASAILEKEPEPLSTIAPAAAPLEPLLQWCLAKDPNDRIETAHDLAIQLRWSLQSAPRPTQSASRGRKQPWVWAVAAIVCVAVAIAAYWIGSRPQPGFPLHVEVSPPENLAFQATGDYGGAPVLSPSGDRIVFSAQGANRPKALWLRPLNSFAAQRLEGTDGASHPFWSVDGKYLGFLKDGSLYKMLAGGGPLVRLAAAENGRGESWCRGDIILFAPNFQGPIMRVSGDGGTATPATTVDAAKHSTHRWPFCLPDGKHFLYLAANHKGGNPQENGIYYASLDGKENRFVVATDASAIYAAGYLLYHAQNSVMAQAFDASFGKLSGDAVTLLDKVKYDSGVWRMLLTASDNGLLAYLAGEAGAAGTQLVWIDRNGKTLATVGEHGSESDPRLSPDGRRLAFVSGDPNWDVWVLDLERGTRSRITFDRSVKSAPSWSPDGKMLAFGVSDVGGAGAFETIHGRPASGGGSDQVLAAEPKVGLIYPQYSPDGKYLVYLRRQNVLGVDIVAKPLAGGDPIEVVKAPGPQANLDSFRISPNGRWIAYQSTESGLNEIYVAPFPRGEGRWQVSSGGGDFPTWRADSRELYFRSNGPQFQVASVIEQGGSLAIGIPQPLFSANASATGISFDAGADGKRFLVNRADDQGPTVLNVVSSWTAELMKK